MCTNFQCTKMSKYENNVYEIPQCLQTTIKSIAFLKFLTYIIQLHFRIVDVATIDLGNSDTVTVNVEIEPRRSDLTL